MLKKVLATVVSLFLVAGNSFNQVSASLPKVFFCNNQNIDNFFINPAAQNFLINFQVLVRQPLYELLSDFSSMYSFNNTDNNGHTRKMIFRDDAQVVDLANRIRSLNVNRIRPLEEIVNQILNGNIPSRLPSDYLQRVNDAIEELRNQMSSLPPHAPTFSDVIENMCIDANLSD